MTKKCNICTVFEWIISVAVPSSKLSQIEKALIVITSLFLKAKVLKLTFF
ncbi:MULTISPECIES: hypothetical protein [Psychrobacillus]|uniref:Uncharacterized protein n=1 Tax=Psychrobacillus faecigallinarum TaxID=2762235 RepID=A0ABR8RFU3_9BACI|nr:MULTISPECIES: hypothetical protein [Psychrobacillus]MBD7946417.1 hypothetical protein [Psychrobacillus faecigallinarum]GGA43459.1 hypothetical protein GCM10011384_36570 [Psychrobacillus lasiicapitis]